MEHLVFYVQKCISKGLKDLKADLIFFLQEMHLSVEGEKYLKHFYKDQIFHASDNSKANGS